MHQLWHPDITQHGTASSGTSTPPSEFTNQIRAAYANSHFNSRRVARRQTRASNAVLVFAESRNEHDMRTIEARKHNVITTVTRVDRNVHMVQRIARYGSPSSAFTRRWCTSYSVGWMVRQLAKLTHTAHARPRPVTQRAPKRSQAYTAAQRYLDGNAPTSPTKYK